MAEERDVQEIGDALASGGVAPDPPQPSGSGSGEGADGEKKEKWEMSTQEKLAEGRRLKDEGNQLYKAGDHEKASSAYERALGFYYFYHESFDEKGFDDEVQMGRIVLHLNLAASLLVLKKYDAAEDQLKTVLKSEKLEDAQRAKALYRLGQAKIGLHEWDAAVEHLLAAAKLEPQNPNIRAAIEAAKKGKVDDAKQLKQVYSKMVRKPQSSSPEPESSSTAAAAASAQEPPTTTEELEKQAAEKALRPDDSQASKASQVETAKALNSTRSQLYITIGSIIILLIFAIAFRFMQASNIGSKVSPGRTEL